MEKYTTGLDCSVLLACTVTALGCAVWNNSFHSAGWMNARGKDYFCAVHVK